MSFWDAAVKVFSTATSGGGVLPLLALGGAAAYSAYDQSRENTEAARIAAEGERQRARAIERANIAATNRLGVLVENAAPGQAHLRSVVAANPYVLTPRQTTELETIRRETTRGLNASGLRGSGRAQVAAFREVVGGARDRFFESNRGRQDRAASGLAGQFQGAVSSQATIDQDTGRAIGDASRVSGGLRADATTANASLRGQAIGDIASFISQDVKDRRRESRYKGLVDTQTGRRREERV